MKSLAILGGAIVAVVLATSTAGADGRWLDRQPPVQWNTPRMAIPHAPPAEVVVPGCGDTARPADTAEDREVIRAGWHLFGSYVGGWDMLVIRANSAYDGMCRPDGYQYFVFVHGLFAGAVSPELMHARTDGSANEIVIEGADRLTVVFDRYAETDPLCCPSRTSTANYRIDRSRGAPVLALAEVSTQSTGE
jgi:hypothetical protein